MDDENAISRGLRPDRGGEPLGIGRYETLGEITDAVREGFECRGVTTTSAAATAALRPVSVAAKTVADPSSLAYTGSDDSGLVGLGGILMLLGAALMVVRRRVRTRRD